MLIDFNKIQEVIIPHLNNGDGSVSAKMFIESNNKIMISRLPAGASIGMHQHTTSSEMNYVISGSGRAVCDDIEEELTVGNCQYCPKGSTHSIMNIGIEELILFTVVSEQ